MRSKCQNRFMSSTEKVDQILDASLVVFCRYGFSKTTMKDLADAAGISRASLYLHFSNKEDLFRAGSERAHATVMADVETVLNIRGPVIERIDKAMTAYLQGLMEEISASPHGQELFASNLALSSDITQMSRQRLSDRIAEVLAEAAAMGEIRLTDIGATPSELAGLILATVEGIKAAGGAGGQISSGGSLFMRILGAAISQ
ncbi:TetR/AcrR family transcriptional regulator [Cryobacterium sp. TMN-39-2]|nr:TetR family transcriptional regulator [Cryobacterium zongtaii]TFC41984.1 TetR/AcrR family transcriptional regulator [Cryobacterium sp. TMN-39-2]